jgi:hypothetical protein
MTNTNGTESVTTPISGSGNFSATPLADESRYSPCPFFWCFIVGLAVILLAAVLALNRRRLASVLQAHPNTHIWWKIAEWVCALVSAAFGDYFEIFKATSWSKAGSHPYGPVLAVVGFGSLFVAMGHVRDGIRDTADEKIEELKRKADINERQRNLWIGLLHQIGSIIEKKMKRVESIAKKAIVTKSEFLGALNPDEQVHLIIQSIYEFFRFRLYRIRPGAKLRLALYMRDETGERLEPAFSWDGENRDCVSNNPEQMELSSPQGVLSVVVQCYNLKGHRRMIIIPNCLGEPQFDYFRPEQKEYLKCLLAFKYKTDHAGTTDALVLALDCDEPNFFHPDHSEELQEFFTEMLKRVDYELLMSETSEKLTLP